MHRNQSRAKKRICKVSGPLRDMAIEWYCSLYSKLFAIGPTDYYVVAPVVEAFIFLIKVSIRSFVLHACKKSEHIDGHPAQYKGSVLALYPTGMKMLPLQCSFLMDIVIIFSHCCLPCLLVLRLPQVDLYASQIIARVYESANSVEVFKCFCIVRENSHKMPC